MVLESSSPKLEIKKAFRRKTGKELTESLLKYWGEQPKITEPEPKLDYDAGLEVFADLTK